MCDAWRKSVLIPFFLLFVLLNLSSLGSSRHLTAPPTLQLAYKKNESTDDATLRPPRRNDKAMKLLDDSRGAKYSYYYLGKSVTYFILFYVGWYALYIVAHIFRSIFLHKVSPPPGHVLQGLNWLQYYLGHDHWMRRKRDAALLNDRATNVLQQIEKFSMANKVTPQQ